MTALTSTVPFQNALRSCPGKASGAQRRVLVCRAQTSEPDWGKKVGVHLLAAGLALSVSLGHVNVAEAGVVIEQPKARKLFQGVKKAVTPEPTAPTASDGGGFSLPSVPSLPSVGLPGIPLPDLSGLNVPTEAGIDPRTIALPGAIVGLAGAGFAAYTLDSGFRNMMREGLVKDSSDYAGYEQAIDDYAAQAGEAVSKGTKKIAKTAKKGTQKAKAKAGGGGKGKGEGGGLFGFLKRK